MTAGRDFESIQVDEVAPVPRSRLVLAGTDELPPEVDFLAAVRAQASGWPLCLSEEQIAERGAPECALFAAEYQNEPPPAQTLSQIREFVRTEDRGRVRIGSVLADCPATVRRAFLDLDRRGRLATDATPEALGIPVVYDQYARRGTIALLDRSGVPLLVVHVPEDGPSA
jgi:hypothetical protein